MNDKKRKVLIVTHWFYPRQIPRAFRAYELYKQLSKENYVDVIIGDWREILKHGESCEKLDGYLKGSTNEDNKTYSNSKIIQLCKKIVEYFVGERYILFSGKFLKKHIKLNDYDSVISIGLPFYVHWLTAKKVNKYKKMGGNITSISDWGDPFVGETVKKLAPYFFNIQRNVCETFDYIVTPTDSAIEYYKKYANANKIRVIPQGMDFNEIKITPYVKSNIPRFVYAGVFYENIRNPQQLLEYLSELDEKFVFTIYTIKHGPIYTNIIRKFERILGEKLVVHDMIPRKDCINELSKNEFLINIENQTSTQIPSKLIDYTLSNRPILSFKQDEIPKDKFKRFLSGNYEGTLNIDLSQFDTNKVTQQFMKIIIGDKENEQ